MIDILRAQISAEESKPAGEQNEERLSALREQVKMFEMSAAEPVDGENDLYQQENIKAVTQEFPEDTTVEVEATSFDEVLD